MVEVKRFSIGEVSERAGIATSALRYYEDNGLIHSERNSSGHRRYHTDVLRRVSFIRTAQHVGLSLGEIAEALGSLPDERTPTAKDWDLLARSWRPRLDEQITILASARPAGRMHRVRMPLDCRRAGCGILAMSPPSSGPDHATS